MAYGEPDIRRAEEIEKIGQVRWRKAKVVQRYRWPEKQEMAAGYSDSDWAGCWRTARSTSGGVLVVGRHLIKSWSSTQKRIALSSGEAELTASVKLITELVGMLQLLKDWGRI